MIEFCQKSCNSIDINGHKSTYLITTVYSLEKIFTLRDLKMTRYYSLTILKFWAAMTLASL